MPRCFYPCHVLYTPLHIIMIPPLSPPLTVIRCHSGDRADVSMESR